MAGPAPLSLYQEIYTIEKGNRKSRLLKWWKKKARDLRKQGSKRVPFKVSLSPSSWFSETLGGVSALQLATLQRRHMAAHVPSEGAPYPLIKIPSENLRLGQCGGSRRPLTFQQHERTTQNRHTTENKQPSYLVPMSFRAASLNVYPMAGQSFVNLQCFWLPKKHCLKPLFLFP